MNSHNHKNNTINWRNCFDIFALITVILLLSGCIKDSTIKSDCSEITSSYNQSEHQLEKKARFIIFQNRKWGFIDRAGKVVIEPQFNYVRLFSENRAAFKDGGDRWGFIDPQGTIVIQPQFEAVSDFVDDRATFSRNNRWGVITSSGQILFEKEFNFLKPLGEKLYAFKKNNQWGVITSRGQVIIEAKFSEIGKFSENRAAFLIENGKKDRIGFIDSQGQIVFKLPEDIRLNYYNDVSIEQFNNGRLPVFAYSPGLVAIKDFFTERASSGQIRDKWGAIDLNGNQVIPLKYDRLGQFSGCLAEIKVGNKTGFININSKVIVKPKFENAFNFSRGLAPVKMDGKWGYINQKGKIVIEPQFQEASNFRQGLAEVVIDNKWGYINQKGKFVWSGSLIIGKKPAWKPVY